jgi:chromosome transmission fidelity protein 1
MNDDLEMGETTKIFYCSRTHSQLTQFAHEVRRVKIPLEIIDSSNTEKQLEAIKHLSLGSRKNLCINKDVQKLGSTTAINERCLELQQGKASNSKKCQYIPNKENETLVHQFRDHALAKIRDIEDLGELGKKVGICPYYASRATIKPSEVGCILVFSNLTNILDRHPTISFNATKVSKRSFGFVIERSCCDHRRSPQPYGCYIGNLLC